MIRAYGLCHSTDDDDPLSVFDRVPVNLYGKLGTVVTAAGKSLLLLRHPRWAVREESPAQLPIFRVKASGDQRVNLLTNEFTPRVAEESLDFLAD
jgi:hypothetical protein